MHPSVPNEEPEETVFPANNKEDPQAPCEVRTFPGAGAPGAFLLPVHWRGSCSGWEEIGGPRWPPAAVASVGAGGEVLCLWGGGACCRMWIACGMAWAACGELAPERPSDPWFVKSPQPYNRDRSMMTDRAMDSWLAGAFRRIPPPPACWPAGPGLFPPERP